MMRNRKPRRMSMPLSLRPSTKSPIAGAFPVQPRRLRCGQEKRERSTMNDGTPIRPARNVELGASGEEFQNLHEFVRKAPARLNQNAWAYIVGPSEPKTPMHPT